MNRIKLNRNLGNDLNFSLPIGEDFTQLGLSQSIDSLVFEETNNTINPYNDYEKIAYKTPTTDGININFRFLDESTNTYVNDYSAMGFDTNNGLSKNSFTKSFFRLYFYDENEPENRNLLFFEELDVVGTKVPLLNLKKIFWYRNDYIFNTTTNNKTLYVVGRFFNALDGKVYDFYNLPLSYTSPVDITQYSQNSTWWSSPMMLINPNNNNGNHIIAVLPFQGANTNNTITLTQRVIL